jgi:hypothetical protein
MNNKTIIYIANNAESLTRVLLPFSSTSTVEAEYGDTTVRGTWDTLAHHGQNASNPCPCTVTNQEKAPEAIGVSHSDLDTLGGVMAVLGIKPETPEFWETAAFVDLNGAHKLEQCPSLTPKIREQLQAFWAWSESNRLFPPRDGTALDVTEFFETAFDIITRLLNDDTELLQAGREWAAAKKRLDAESIIQERSSGVIVREHSTFVNHLYRESGIAVVALNSTHGSVTVSLADPIPGVSCREVVQSLWGPEAGGHDGIAGSPRGRVMTNIDLKNAADAVELALNNA